MCFTDIDANYIEKWKKKINFLLFSLYIKLILVFCLLPYALNFRENPHDIASPNLFDILF